MYALFLMMAVSLQVHDPLFRQPQPYRGRLPEDVREQLAARHGSGVFRTIHQALRRVPQFYIWFLKIRGDRPTALRTPV